MSDIFADGFAVTASFGAGVAGSVPGNISSSVRFRRKIASFEFIPLLDQPFVPRWFLEYVLYHEMLHSVVRDETDAAGRRRIHTEEFYRREKAFPSYRRARKWEDENLARFLR